ncbi:DHHC zinc finger membrane protein [Histoplasma capsulatum G186AR]|uniref:Rhomboid-type serine protease n=1 Tax=Ajellomyces capsulatus (strain G186AR / H82 / ATCC MYA-2454 / RMSCC 2432) TaxID=447093 RepID=C0NWF4_AJECG|nr:DHHC zinc finger membrane protein [Histoplasma capsulatum G186AR]EEH04259.1 DHHC zinc finger membrane protein [Histoplasma capsulatum G186AR]
MAANDFYQPYTSDHSQLQQQQQQQHQPLNPDRTSPPPVWSNQSLPPLRTPSPYGAYGNPYDRDGSQYNPRSDHGYPPSPGVQSFGGAVGGGIGMTGRPHGTDYYADDIPLKANAQPTTGGRPEWMDPDTHYPLERESQRVPLNPNPTARHSKGWERKGRRWLKKKIPFVTYFVTLVQVAVFIAELVRSGSPIMTKPQFNPMIGPSPYIQIYMGARYVPCMRNVEGVQNNPNATNGLVPFPCPNTTTSDPFAPENLCPLSDLCGFKKTNKVHDPTPQGSLDDKPEPNQWFRFIVPIFLHAGLIHIGFNMMAQLTIGADMERTIGWWRYAVVYFASGIFGFILGANFAPPGIPSTGASGSLFGIFALAFLDLLYSWSSRSNPVKELLIMLITVAISFVLGLLPGLDNFSHIGGFMVGLVLGISVLRSPDKLRRRIDSITPHHDPYDPLSASGALGAGAGAGDAIDNPKTAFMVKQPVKFFQGRKPLWWAWWVVRAGTLVGILVAFILLLNNFYKYRSTCGWCKYLSCLPIAGKNWCDVGKLG